MREQATLHRCTTNGELEDGLSCHRFFQWVGELESSKDIPPARKYEFSERYQWRHEVQHAGLKRHGLVIANVS